MSHCPGSAEESVSKNSSSAAWSDGSRKDRKNIKVTAQLIRLLGCYVRFLFAMEPTTRTLDADPSSGSSPSPTDMSSVEGQVLECIFESVIKEREEMERGEKKRARQKAREEKKLVTGSKGTVVTPVSNAGVAANGDPEVAEDGDEHAVLEVLCNKIFFFAESPLIKRNVWDSVWRLDSPVYAFALANTLKNIPGNSSSHVGSSNTASPTAEEGDPGLSQNRNLIAGLELVFARGMDILVSHRKRVRRVLMERAQEKEKKESIKKFENNTEAEDEDAEDDDDEEEVVELTETLSSALPGMLGVTVSDAIVLVALLAPHVAPAVLALQKPGAKLPTSPKPKPVGKRKATKAGNRSGRATPPSTVQFSTTAAVLEKLRGLKRNRDGDEEADSESVLLPPGSAVIRVAVFSHLLQDPFRRMRAARELCILQSEGKQKESNNHTRGEMLFERQRQSLLTVVQTFATERGKQLLKRHTEYDELEAKRTELQKRKEEEQLLAREEKKYQKLKLKIQQQQQQKLPHPTVTTMSGGNCGDAIEDGLLPLGGEVQSKVGQSPLTAPRPAPPTCSSLQGATDESDDDHDDQPGPGSSRIMRHQRMVVSEKGTSFSNILFPSAAAAAAAAGSSNPSPTEHRANAQTINNDDVAVMDDQQELMDMLQLVHHHTDRSVNKFRDDTLYCTIQAPCVSFAVMEAAVGHDRNGYDIDPTTVPQGCPLADRSSRIQQVHVLNHRDKTVFAATASAAGVDVTSPEFWVVKS